MSEIYVSEPPTNGKVLIHTTLGDIDIELWSKECPITVRNFIQLCLEGYYDNNIFHRIIKKFMLQTGDPTGSGSGGESIYGKSFIDEFHSRLKFTHRGIVAMANSGKDDNNSQFFITFDKCDWLNKKHTIFGKVTGNSIFNVLQAQEVEVDKDDRPINVAPKILSVEVLHNPFDDIYPRATKVEKKVEVKQVKVVKKNTSLLSFGNAEEEDNSAFVAKKGSAHDFKQEDTRLVPAPPVESFKGDITVSIREKLTKKDGTQTLSANAAMLISKSMKPVVPLKPIVEVKSKSSSRSRSRSYSCSRSRSRDYSRSRSRSPLNPEESKTDNFIRDRRRKLDEMKSSQMRNRGSNGIEHDEELMTDLERRRAKYIKKKKMTKDRETHTLEKLNLFKESLSIARDPNYLKTRQIKVIKEDTEVVEADDWKTHAVQFVHRPQDFDPLTKNQDVYEYASYDPRKARTLNTTSN